MSHDGLCFPMCPTCFPRFRAFFRGFHHSTPSTPSLRQLNAELPQLLAEAEQLQAERVPGVEGVGGVQDKDRDLDGI